jgi:hypothetical protein
MGRRKEKRDLLILFLLHINKKRKSKQIPFKKQFTNIFKKYK